MEQLAAYEMELYGVQTFDLKDYLVEVLQEMGFAKDKAISALKAASSNYH